MENVAKEQSKDIEIIFPKKKLNKEDYVWALHHTEIPGFTFIYDKLLEAAKKLTADTELIKRFHEHQTDNVKRHYEKQTELPDEEFYGEYERRTIMQDPNHQSFSVSSNSSHQPVTFMKNFDITPKKPQDACHITTPYYDAHFNYGYISGKGAMLACTRHPIARYMDQIYKSIYGNIKYTEVRGLFWYPKGGFREWHTNEYTRQGWRLYLVYADEDEKSWFSFKHPETGKLHIQPDRTGYINIFKVTKDPPFWHNVYSQTNRISLGIHVTDEFIEKFIEFV
jgi:hypothetical protein